jgi:hypothetical protein
MGKVTTVKDRGRFTVSYWLDHEDCTFIQVKERRFVTERKARIFMGAKIAAGYEVRLDTEKTQ